MSVVVVLDGSLAAAVAANFALLLAKALNRELVAQTFVDSTAVMQLTGYRGIPGLCGSGVFLEAYEKIVAALICVNETLLLSFCARAEGCGLTVKSCVDIGNRENILANRSTRSILVLAEPMGRELSDRLLLTDWNDCTVILVNEDGSVTILANDASKEQMHSIIRSHLPNVRVLTRRFGSVGMEAA